MKINIIFLTPTIFLLLLGCSSSQEIALFDGKTLNGWEGNLKTWRVEDGAIVGGSLTDTVPHNEFLCTTRSFDNFILKLRFKLEGHEGFINAGVQFRSQRVADPSYEMIGYQADLGHHYYGALYDESRRNKVLAGPDSTSISRLIKLGEWNDYEIRAQGNHIQLFLNGQQTADFIEPDASLPKEGLIGLQIHGGGKARVSYREIWMKRG